MKKDKMLIAVISELWVYGDLNIKMTFSYLQSITMMNIIFIIRKYITYKSITVVRQASQTSIYMSNNLN